MTLPTGQISMSQVNTELSKSSTALISLNDSDVRALAGVPSGAISMANLQGKSNVSFTPDGGTTLGTAVYLSSDVSYQEAEITIACSQNATWNYTRTSTSGNGSEFVSIASGAVSPNIAFRLNTVDNTIATRQWSVNATAGGITRYWTVYLRSEYV